MPTNQLGLKIITNIKMKNFHKNNNKKAILPKKLIYCILMEI